VLNDATTTDVALRRVTNVARYKASVKVLINEKGLPRIESSGLDVAREGGGSMSQEGVITHKGLKTPRAAAIAGILFSVLLITSQLLIWSSLPAISSHSASEVVGHSNTVSLALNMLPFAGVAFLWFIAVVRDRLGVLEDRFFATVFLGSGLLYLAMTFTSGAMAGGLIRILQTTPDLVTQTGTYAVARAQIHGAMNTYGIKMAGVFMFSTSTILMRTGIVRRWIPFLGFALAITLLLSIGTIQWIPFVFPAWVFLISADILIQNLAGPIKATAEQEPSRQ
jgi:hypothetical protein